MKKNLRNYGRDKRDSENQSKKMKSQIFKEEKIKAALSTSYHDIQGKMRKP